MKSLILVEKICVETRFLLKRFMLKNIFSKPHRKFNSFKFTPGFNGQAKSIGRMHSLSLEACTDLITLIKGDEIRNWRFVFHGGAGISSYGNVDSKRNDDY